MPMIFYTLVTVTIQLLPLVPLVHRYPAPRNQMKIYSLFDSILLSYFLLQLHYYQLSYSDLTPVAEAMWLRMLFQLSVLALLPKPRSFCSYLSLLSLLPEAFKSIKTNMTDRSVMFIN